MGDYFYKVGTTLYDAFDYSVSGLATGDFTIQVDKNGVAGSNAGITIAQVGATQSYIVTVNSITGFVAAAGAYHLTIYHTSAPLNRWDTMVRVTTDGLPSGSTGTANFTAIVGNGRVTDGTNPINGATIRFSRPSGGGFYTSTTTNSSGLWGPVYFDVDGAWNFTAQISGYTLGSGTVTVSSGVATGPGTDIALTAMSSSGITLSQLTAYARRMYRDRTGSKVEAELTQVVNDSLMMLATEHAWPWYQTVGRVTVRAAYSTGTISITNGSSTVSLTGGSFPYTTVGVNGVAEIYINGMYHRLLSLTSSTATLVNSWQEANYSGSYTLAQIEYTLPSDLMRLSKITATNEWVWGPDPISRFALEEARQRWRLSSTQPPRMWAIERDRLVVWPAPGTDKMCNILYMRRPAELVSPGDTADWDANLIELLRRAIDYQVACRGDCVAGDKAETFKTYRECISRNVSQDRTATDMRAGLVSNGYDDLRIPGVTILG